ncbi:neuromedin-U receptor 2-like [Patiria miniata]|uniref:G-protein coupled receptors family 1 profile domain-containing protein n=1 Tax=Patiria miniata TaxID=46514 RepID=A0A913ZPA2_PATMI|nr:neuromedin-U receptor 2-like [Patiria miniata]
MEPAGPDGLVWANFTEYSYYYMYYVDPVLQDAYDWSDVINAISTKGIIPFGLLTNLIFLFVVIRVRAMHTPINIHLSNLAVADMLFLLINVFQYATGIATLATGVLTYLPYLASMLFVTAMAAGRCFAIYCPFRARTGPTTCRAVVVAVVVWVVSLLFSVAFNLIVYSQSVDGLVLNLLYLLINPIFLVVNVVLYACVIGGLFKHRRINASTALSQRRLVFMLVTNTAVFFAFHIAATSFNLYAMFNPMPRATAVIGHALIYMLSFLNSSVNPLVYTATNAEYRAAFLSAFTFPCCRGCRFGKNKQRTNYIAIRERARTASNSNGPMNCYELRDINPNSLTTDVPEFVT